MPSPGQTSGIAFFEGNAYIVDKNNHRILKFSPGSSEGEVFFGGKGSGFDLDQLDHPSGRLAALGCFSGVFAPESLVEAYTLGFRGGSCSGLVAARLLT